MGCIGLTLKHQRSVFALFTHADVFHSALHMTPHSVQPQLPDLGKPLFGHSQTLCHSFSLSHFTFPISSYFWLFQHPRYSHALHSQSPLRGIAVSRGIAESTLTLAMSRLIRLS
jgi:hypothetical protein